MIEFSWLRIAQPGNFISLFQSQKEEKEKNIFEGHFFLRKHEN